MSIGKGLLEGAQDTGIGKESPSLRSFWRLQSTGC